MAEAFVKKIEDFLSCAICFEQLKDPVGLPCLHGFCFECLENWHRASQKKTQVICPACKKTSQLPKNGIRGFPAHFFVNNLRETVDMEKQKVDISAKIQVGDKVSHRNTNLEGTVQSRVGEQIVVDFSGEIWIGGASHLHSVSTDTTGSAPCDLCSNSAINHCLDCKQYLCKQCHKQHDAFKLMKKHKVVAAMDVLSGKISSQGRHCPIHSELIRFYCHSEDKQVCHDCVTLKTCAVEHNRVPLSEAAKTQFGKLQHLLSVCEEKKEAYLSRLSKTEKIRDSLDTSYQKANEALENVFTETIEKLQETFQQKRIMLTEKYSIKDKQLNDAHGELKSKVLSSQKACSLAGDVISHGSDHDITFKYSTLKTTMEGVVFSNDQYNISESLGNFSFEPGKPEDYIKLKSDTAICKDSKQDDLSTLEEPKTTRHASGQWKQTFHFITTDFPCPSDIAVFPDGALVIASEKRGANVYSLLGTYKCTLKCTPKKLYAIAVTPDGRIITDGKTKLLCYNRDGKQLHPITTMDPPTAIAVDKTGRIIAGMDNRIAIHSSDGSQISCFVTSKKPYYISTTSQNTLVVTLESCDDIWTLHVMTYHGRIITEIYPPHKGIYWNPGNTCCNSRDEIFVINDADEHIFWYTHEGQYLGRVTADLKCPTCLTISSYDELIVAEENGTVKYFMRPE